MLESPPDIDYERLSAEQLRAKAESVASEKRRLEHLEHAGKAYDHGEDAVTQLEEWLAEIHAELRECSCSDCAAEQSPA